MKSITLRLLAVVMILGMLIGASAGCRVEDECKSSTSPSIKKDTPSETTLAIIDHLNNYKLTVWSNCEDADNLSMLFEMFNEFGDVYYVEMPEDRDEFMQAIISAAAGEDYPDVILVDDMMVRELIERDLLCNLSELQVYTDYIMTYRNTIDVGTDRKTGDILAYSFQNSPGVVSYRRDLARKYLGTDDPDEIQAMLSDWVGFTTVAEILKTESEGRVRMISGIDELCRPFLATREQPWIVNDSLHIDPKIDELMQLAQTFTLKGYTAGIKHGEEAWLASMNGAVTTESGEEAEVFCYFLPPWGIRDYLVRFGQDLDGQYGLCPGPAPFQWGGTWIGVMKNARNPDAAKSFIWFSALIPWIQKDWTTGAINEEYLANLDPQYWCGDANNGVPELPIGYFLSNPIVVDELTPFFEESETSDFLGGQNFYDVYAEAASLWNGNIIQGSDEIILKIFLDYLNRYVSGDLTKEEAITGFEESVAPEVDRNSFRE